MRALVFTACGRATALAALVLLGACGPSVAYVYVKSGTTPEQFARDQRECEDEATLALPAGATAGTYRRVDADRFDLCMRRRGYEVRTREDLQRRQTP